MYSCVDHFDLIEERSTMGISPSSPSKCIGSDKGPGEHTGSAVGGHGNGVGTPITQSKQGQGQGEPDVKTNEVFVLPDEEFFLSVLLVPGCSPPDQDCTYFRSKGRTRGTLRWAIHRSIRHGCQPAMMWTTPFVDSDAPKQGEGSLSSLEIVRYLSQFAFDFVFDTNNRRAATSGSKEKRIVVYILSPICDGKTTDCDDISVEIDNIRALWARAAKGKHNVRPCCVVLKKEHFDEEIVCRPPRIQDLGSDLSADAESTSTPPKSNDQEKGEEGSIISAMSDGTCENVSVEQMALIRGAGLLYGYPALVINCNPNRMDATCCDERGTVIGSAGGFGLGAKLREACAADVSHDAVDDAGQIQFEATHEEIRDSIASILGDERKKEIMENTRCLVAYWLFRLNAAKTKKADDEDEEVEKAADTAALQRLERLAAAAAKVVRGEVDCSKRTPIFRAMYERRNQRKAVVISGVDSDLVGEIVETKPGSITFNPLEQDIGGKDEKLRFPWNNSTAASCWKGEEEEGKDSEVHYNSLRHVSNLQISKYHLAHYGVAACVFGNYITSEFRDNIIGRRVAKRFINPDKAKAGGNVTNEIYRGSVTSIEGKVGEDYFHVVYDDGDSEHVGRNELVQMATLYSQVGEEGDEITIVEKEIGTKRSLTEGDDEGEEPQRRRRKQKPLCHQGIYHFF